MVPVFILWAGRWRGHLTFIAGLSRRSGKGHLWVCSTPRGGQIAPVRVFNTLWYRMFDGIYERDHLQICCAPGCWDVCPVGSAPAGSQPMEVQTKAHHTEGKQREGQLPRHPSPPLRQDPVEGFGAPNPASLPQRLADEQVCNAERPYRAHPAAQGSHFPTNVSFSR